MWVFSGDVTSPGLRQHGKDRLLTDGDAPPTVRVAVIGCGYWGRNLVRNFAELGALAAICDPDQAAAGQLAGRYQAPVRELDAVLGDPGVTAVAIATPAVQHAALARAAITAGKHVFVEK